MGREPIVCIVAAASGLLKVGISQTGRRLEKLN